MSIHDWTLAHILLFNLLTVKKWHLLGDSHPHCAEELQTFSSALARFEAQLPTVQEWGCRMEVIVSIMRLCQELIVGEDEY